MIAVNHYELDELELGERVADAIETENLLSFLILDLGIPKWMIRLAHWFKRITMMDVR